MSALSLLLFSAILVLTCHAQVQSVNVRANIQIQPNGGRSGQTLRFPPVIQIQEVPSLTIYKCEVNVSVKQLYVPALYNTHNPKPVVTSGDSITSTTGSAEFTSLILTNLGAYVHLVFTVSANVQGFTRTWELWSGAFHIGAPDPDYTHPPITPLTSPPGAPGSPFAFTPCMQDFRIDRTSVGPPANECEPFGQQPTFTIYDARNNLCSSVPVSTAASIIQAPSGGENVTLNGSTTLSTTGGPQFSDLMICAGGSGWVLEYNLTIQPTNGTPVSFVFNDTINVQPRSTAAPSPPPTTANPTAPPADFTYAKIIISRQPMWGVAGFKLRQQPILFITDRWNNIMRVSGTATATLFLPFFLQASGATTIGTTQVNSTNGVFEWADLGISTFGYGYYIKFDIDAGPGQKSFTTYSSPVYVQRLSAAGLQHDASDPAPSKSTDLSSASITGIIIGIATFVFLLLVILVVVVVLVIRRKRMASLDDEKETVEAQENPVNNL